MYDDVRCYIFMKRIEVCNSPRIVPLTNEFTTTFEKQWNKFRARWCNCHNLDGAKAFSHDDIKIVMFHRVTQINVPVEEAERLIDDALQYYQEKNFDCIFTLSPLDQPSDFEERLRKKVLNWPLCRWPCSAIALVISQPQVTSVLELLKQPITTYGQTSCVNALKIPLKQPKLGETHSMFRKCGCIWRRETPNPREQHCCIQRGAWAT